MCFLFCAGQFFDHALELDACGDTRGAKNLYVDTSSYLLNVLDDYQKNSPSLPPVASQAERVDVDHWLIKTRELLETVLDYGETIKKQIELNEQHANERVAPPHHASAKTERKSQQQRARKESNSAAKRGSRARGRGRPEARLDKEDRQKERVMGGEEGEVEEGQLAKERHVEGECDEEDMSAGEADAGSPQSHYREPPRAPIVFRPTKTPPSAPRGSDARGVFSEDFSEFDPLLNFDTQNMIYSTILGRRYATWSSRGE